MTNSVMTCGEIEPEQLERLGKGGKYWGFQKVDGDHFKIICKNIKWANGITKEIRLINRHENDYTRQFPEVVAGLGVRKGVNCVLNGEIAYWNSKTQKYDFNALRSRQSLQKERMIMKRRLLFPCKLYVFDLIEVDGINMVNNPAYPYERRYEILKQIIINNNVTELLPIRTDLVNFFKEECLADREGIIIKALSNIYCEGRSDTILKVKNWIYETIKFENFEDNRAGITISNKQGDRVLVAGKKAELVQSCIEQNSYTYEKIRHLQKRNENSNLMREPTHREHIGIKCN